MHPPTPKKDAPPKKRSKKKKALATGATIPPKSNGLHPGGRPSKLSPEITQLLSESIADGLTDAQAAALADISEDTLSDWRKNPEFLRAIQKSDALRTLDRLALIRSGKNGWPGMAWFMERRYPKLWAAPHVQLNPQVNVQVNNTTNTTNVLSANADALRQLLSGPALADDVAGLPAPTPDDVP
jgi:hypothetical protein